MTLADRIVLLDAGRARQIGTPIELYHAPADLFVAGFIGSPKMNFINVEAQDADRGSITVAGAGLAPFRVPAVLPSSMQPGARLTQGVRPEHAQPMAHGGHMRGRVEVVEQLGPQTQLGIRLEDGTMLISAADGADPSRVGDQRDIAFDAAAVHLFGPDGTALQRPELVRVVAASAP